MIKLETILFLAFLSTASHELWAAEVAGTPKALDSNVYGEMKDAQNGSEDTLKKLLSIKGVDEQYQKCKLRHTVKLEKIPGCIWEELESFPNVKKEVQAMYASEVESNKRSPASATTPSTSNLTNKSKNLSEDYMSDPAVIELSKILKKKLEEAMLGDEEAQKDTKSVAIVDHAKYNELYKSELGKTIINAFTSYCVEADFAASETISIKESYKSCKDSDNKPAPCRLVILSDPLQTKDKIKANLASLRSANLSTSTASNSNPESDKWNRCIGSVGNVCYTDTQHIDGANSGLQDQLKHSKTRACTIMDYVKSARKNLILVDEQKKFYQTLEGGVSVQLANARVVEVNEKNSIDATTTVTSGDIESSYEKKNEALKKEMDKCMGPGDTIVDAESCKKFISTDATAKEKALTEFGIRQFALEEKIEEKFENKEEIKKYLIEEGYDKKKIDMMISSDAEIDKVKQEIKDRYKSEREAIIASMAEKIKSKTTESDGKIDTTQGSADQEKLKKIREELSGRSDDLKQLVHFNNVVSSYLETSKDGKKSRNVASLFAEIKGGAKTMKDIDKEQLKDIEKKAGEAGLKQDKSGTGTDLSVDTLNGLFKYTTEK